MERHVTLEQLDFRLLKAFLVLYDERNVGRAADVLGIAQPVMSTLLRRLRDVAGDTLFVRSQKGMQPTRLADRWADPVRLALASLERMLNARETFVAAESRRTFVVYMSDAGQATMIGRICEHMLTEAPHARLQVVGTWSGSISDRLDDGSIDLALGWLPQLKARKASVSLFKDRYVGVRMDAAPRVHWPRIATALRCAVASMPGTPHQVVIERFVKQGIEPAVVVPTFFMLPEVLRGGSDLVAIMPSTLARMFLSRHHDSLQIQKPPFSLPTLDVRLYWSPGAHRDPGLEWLKELVVGCVRDHVVELTDRAYVLGGRVS